MSPILAKGLLVTILSFHEYTGCIGKYITEHEQLAALVMVYCPKSDEVFVDMAGIPTNCLRASNEHEQNLYSRRRPWSNR